jgi:hypothetical protein
MRHRIALLLLLVTILLAGGIPSQAQTGGTCPPAITAAVASIGAACNNLDRNSACYGNFNVQATFSQPVDASIFDQPSDRAPLDLFQSIRTAPFATSGAEWGVAVLNLQADIPNALPGQVVTIMLLGDTQMQNVADPNAQTPMQAFTFSTGIAPSCAQIPPSSLVVQGPRGLVVDLSINGANVRLGSTAVLRTDDHRVEFATLDGRIVIEGRTIISKGFTAFVEMDDDGYIIEDSWGDVEAMDADELEQFGALEEMPEDLFGYAVDMPEMEEIEMMEMLGFDLLDSIDPYTLDEMIDQLLEDGIDPETLVELSDDEYYQLLYDSLTAADPALGDAFYEALTGEDVDGDGLIAGFDSDAYYSGDGVYGYGDEFAGMDFEALEDEADFEEGDSTELSEADTSEAEDEEFSEELPDEEPPVEEGGEEGGE